MPKFPLSRVQHLLASAAAVVAATVVAAPAAAQSTPTPTPKPTTSQNKPYNRMIVFGDSLSDGGAYAALVPAGAGSFTTNPDPVTPEVAAARLGLALTPNVGQNGFNYAEGGGRIAIPQPFNGTTRASVSQQIDRFVAQGRTFQPGDLVYIQGGGNDFFAVGNSAGLDTAAVALVGQIQRLQALGAPTIVTVNIQTIARFNTAYENELARVRPNVLFYDVDQLFTELVTSPGTYGITNITGFACVPASSLTCLPANYATPNANRTYLQADAAHPAGIVQEIEGQAIASLIIAPGQISQLAYATQADFRQHRGFYAEHLRRGADRDVGTTQLFFNGGYRKFQIDGTTQRVGLDEDGTVFGGGFDHQLGETTGIGAAIAVGDGDASFEGGLGGYDVMTVSASVFARTKVGPVRVSIDGTYGYADYDDITRLTQLGPALRTQVGQTTGRYGAGKAELGIDLLSGGFFLGPVATIGYETIRVNGYSEGRRQSTDLTFGSRRIHSLTGQAGLEASTELGPIQAFVRGTYDHEFEDDARGFSIQAAGSPIPFVSPAYRADRHYGDVAGELSGELFDGVSVGLGGTYQFERRDMESYSAFGTIKIAM